MSRFWPVVACLAAISSPVFAQQTTRDCRDCPELVRIGAGGFTMGATLAEEEREGTPRQDRGETSPLHEVMIGSTFWLGRAAVTREEFAAFAKATGHRTGDACHAYGADRKWRNIRGRTWRAPGFAQTGRHPVVCVSWDDATAYVVWLSKATGKTYRLPSEAEWEYAARAGTQTARFWGDGRDEACRFANVADRTGATRLGWDNKPETVFRCTDGHAHTSPVGSFPANPWGLSDMLGNVWQWTADCWNETYRGAPADGTPWTSGDCARRVARGGSWSDLPWSVRAANRGWGIAGSRSDENGFRVARSD